MGMAGLVGVREIPRGGRPSVGVNEKRNEGYVMYVLSM
jgi:hypothetical protein